jgi:c-di-GMP-binding flagellar brake protein YcgR
MPAPTITRQPERRRSARVAVALELTLSRGRGNPIQGRTLDVGTGGMRIATARPLAVDEVLAFEFRLETKARAVSGQVRVLREYAQQTYAMRFVKLTGEDTTLLSSFVASAG